MSGSWPNKSLQAKQFATFRSPRQTAARAGFKAAKRSQPDAGLSCAKWAMRSLANSWPDSWPQAVSLYAQLTARCDARFYICWGRCGPVAQGIEQQPSKLKVAGSNPAGVANGPFRTRGLGRCAITWRPNSRARPYRRQIDRLLIALPEALPCRRCPRNPSSFALRHDNPFGRSQGVPGPQGGRPLSSKQPSAPWRRRRRRNNRQV